MNPPKNILQFLEELRGIAQLGLNYTEDAFDKARYEKLLMLAASQYAELFNISPIEIASKFKKEIGHTTPKVGVNAALITKDKELLVTRRSDDGLWELPGGWAELGESPRDALRRELREEIHIDVEPLEVLEIFHRLPGDFGAPHTSYHLVFKCEGDPSQIKFSDEVLEFKLVKSGAGLLWHKEHGTVANTLFFKVQNCIS